MDGTIPICAHLSVIIKNSFGGKIRKSSINMNNHRNDITPVLENNKEKIEPVTNQK
jgi:hypothetical protein